MNRSPFSFLLSLLFNFNGNDIRITDNNGNPWFVAKDVCDVLGLNNVSMALVELDSRDKVNVSGAEVGLKISKLRLVNESGLYDLIFKSRRPEAKQFKRWLTHEVLPQIRKTGGYIP